MSTMAANAEQEEQESLGPVMPTPGLLNCSHLEINKYIASGRKLLLESTDSEEIGTDLNEKNCSAQLNNARRNSRGLLLYHTSHEAKAIELWKETVADDPCNINALQDLATAYSRVKNHQEADCYKVKCQKAIDDARPDDRRMIFARCQMEQACACIPGWTFIPLGKAYMAEHGLQLLHNFDDSFRIAGDILEREEYQKEKRDWLLYRGKIHDAVFWTFIKHEKSEMREKFFRRGVHDLQQCLRLSPDKDAYRAYVLRLLAAVFGQTWRLKETYQDIWEDPSGYFEEALGIDADDVDILIGYGFHCYKIDRLFDAGKLLDKAIEVVENRPQTNPLRNAWPEAWCNRAQVWIKESYELPPQESFDILMKAKEYSERALENSFCYDFILVTAEVYHLLANNKHTSSGDSKVLLHKANQLFFRASRLRAYECGRNETVTLHLKWGRCLSDNTDLHLRCAIESYKIAVDTAQDYHGSFLCMLSKELLDVMLTNYRAQQKPVLLLEELAFWFVYIGNRLAVHVLLEYLPLKKLKWKFAFEILEVMEFIVHHITNLTSSPKDLSNGMLTVAINEMKDWNWHTAAYSRVQRLCFENTEITNDLPTATLFTYRRPRADDEPISRNKALHENFIYDFCVINDEDPDIDGWVKYSLLTGLESMLFCRGLKGFYSKRMRLGQFSYRTWENVIKESAHVLIVLSRDLDESLLTEVAKIANDKGVILLKRQTEVPPKLRVYPEFDFSYLTKVTYLSFFLMPSNNADEQKPL